MSHTITIDTKQKIYEIACGQQGYFTTKQAEEAGFSRKHHSYHVKVGNWIHEMRGLYRLPHFPQNDEDAQLVLWYLWSRDRNENPQGVFSHDTALRIYELSDLMPSKIHMTVPPKFRRFNKIPNILILHKANLSKIDMRFMRGFAVTTPTRTILDLMESGHIEKSFIQQAFNEALKRGMLLPKDEDKIKEIITNEK